MGQRISTVSEEPVKSLGRWFDESLKDINQVKETFRTLQEGLHKIDHCPFTRKIQGLVSAAYIYSDVIMAATCI